MPTSTMLVEPTPESVSLPDRAGHVHESGRSGRTAGRSRPAAYRRGVDATDAKETRDGHSKPERVLIIGRSPGVLASTVALLRGRGYTADATTEFDHVVDRYDPATVDVAVFGGMVPPDTGQRLREQFACQHPDTIFVQGFAGIPGLIAAQVEAAIAAPAAMPRPGTRRLRGPSGCALVPATQGGRGRLVGYQSTFPRSPKARQ